MSSLNLEIEFDKQMFKICCCYKDICSVDFMGYEQNLRFSGSKWG